NFNRATDAVQRPRVLQPDRVLPGKRQRRRIWGGRVLARIAHCRKGKDDAIPIAVVILAAVSFVFIGLRRVAGQNRGNHRQKSSVEAVESRRAKWFHNWISLSLVLIYRPGGFHRAMAGD